MACVGSGHLNSCETTKPSRTTATATNTSIRIQMSRLFQNIAPPLRSVYVANTSLRDLGSHGFARNLIQPARIAPRQQIRISCSGTIRSEEHTSELQSQSNLVC